MTSVEIRPVHGADARMQFIKMPWSLYANDPHWVPPLIADMKEFIDPRKGVFFKQGQAELFLAYRNGKAVGRISAQISHRHREIYNDQKGFFGFFECEDNQQTASALIQAAESYLQSHGCNVVEGPFNFTVYDEIGVLVSGFDSMPFVLNLHNPPYYDALLAQAGYRKSIDWYAYRMTADMAQSGWPDRLIRIADRIASRPGVTIRNMDASRFDREAEIVKSIFNAAWDRNWGHVPLSESEFARTAKALKHLVVPEVSFVAEVKGQPVGFALSVHDVNPAIRAANGRLFPLGFVKLLRLAKRSGRFRLILMGVLEEHRSRGYEVAFTTRVMQRAIERGLHHCEMSKYRRNQRADAQVARTSASRTLQNLPRSTKRTSKRSAYQFDFIAFFNISRLTDALEVRDQLPSLISN